MSERSERLVFRVIVASALCLLGAYVVNGLGALGVIEMKGLALWVSRTLLLLMVSGAIFSLLYPIMTFRERRKSDHHYH